MEMLLSQARRFAQFTSSLPGTTPPGLQGKTIFLIHNSSQRSNPVQALLQERGYRVTLAESVAAALQIWSQLTGRVDLFLADISLGRDHSVEQLVKFLHAENPRMRVLYANDLEGDSSPIAVQRYAHQLVEVIDNCLA